MGGGQSSSALMRAGRHSPEREVRMNVIAVGVKGLFKRRIESFVLCAFRIEEASRRSWRGFGGEGIKRGWRGFWSAFSKFRRRAFVEAIEARRAARLLTSFKVAIEMV